MQDWIINGEVQCCLKSTIIFSTYIPPQRASSSWGFVISITQSIKFRRIKLHLNKEGGLEARTDRFYTWCCTPQWYLSSVEKISLAWYQLLRICSLHQKISEKQKKISRLWLLRIFNQVKAQKQRDRLEEGKAKSQYRREKNSAIAGTFATKIFEKQENVRSLLSEGWWKPSAKPKLKLLVSRTISTLFHQISFTKAKVSICNKVSISTIKDLKKKPN